MEQIIISARKIYINKKSVNETKTARRVRKWDNMTINQTRSQKIIFPWKQCNRCGSNYNLVCLISRLEPAVWTDQATVGNILVPEIAHYLVLEMVTYYHNV